MSILRWGLALRGMDDGNIERGEGRVDGRNERKDHSERYEV